MKTKTETQIRVLKSIAVSVELNIDADIDSVSRDTELSVSDVAKAARSMREVIIDNDDGLHLDFAMIAKRIKAKTYREVINHIKAM